MVKNKAPLRLSLGSYLGLLLLLVSGLPILVFLLWPQSSIYNQKHAEVSERHLLIANSLSVTLEYYHRDVIAVMDSFAMSIADEKAIEARPIFENLKFRHVCVVSRSSGVVTHAYLDQLYGCPDVIPAKLLALMNTLAAPGGVQMSGVRFAPDGQPILLVITGQGEQLIVGALHTDFFIEQQQRINFGEGGHAVIVDQSGRVLAHPLEEWGRTAHDLSGSEIVQRLGNGEQGVMSFESPAGLGQMIAGFASVNGSGWGVIVPQPVREFELAAQSFNREVIFILLIGLGGSMLLAYFLSSSLNNRVQNIQHAVRKLASGRHELSFRPRNTLIDVAVFQDVEEGISKMADDMHEAKQFQEEYSQELEASNRKLQSEVEVRRSAECELREIGARYRALFENVPIPIREEDLSGFKKLVDDLDVADVDDLHQYLDDNPEVITRCGLLAQIINANEASLELHEYEDEDLLIQDIHTEFGPESLAFIRKTIETMYLGKTRMTSETAIYRRSGERREVQSTWSVLPGHEDDFSRVLLTSIDMTERLASERALRQAQKMEAVGQLTGGVAHDFNNLLTVVGGSADLLSLNPAHDHAMIERIHKAVHRGSELTQRLLAFSRIQPLEPQSIDLHVLASEMLDMLQRTVGPNIDINILGAKNLFQITADPGQVEASILNLALNARDAMPNGGRLVIKCREAETEEISELDLQPGAYAALEVADNGTGMSADTLLRAFEPFFTTKDVGKGSGLGLSMVYGFTRQSRGGTLIRSTVGIGTTVILLLPKSETDNEPRPFVRHSFSQSTGHDQTVLVLEDDEGVLNHLISLLTELGYNVVPAPSTAAAWRIVDSGVEFDLLLSDVMLPGQQSGPAFAKALRVKRPGFPVIFVSGYPGASAIGKRQTLRDAIWLTKPFNTSDLSNAIKQLMVPA